MTVGIIFIHKCVCQSVKRLSSHCSVLLAVFLPCERLKEAALLLCEGGMFTIQVYASDILFYIILPYFIIFL